MLGKDLEKAIITGGEGIIGSYINFGRRLTQHDVDVTDKDGVDKIFKSLKPSLVIHLAAATDMEKCEKDPNYAWRTNAWGTFNIAEACRHYGAVLVYVSTGVVFSGDKPEHSESDLPWPQSVYGRSKYVGELAVKDIASEHLIIRTSWVFGGGPQYDHKFVGKIMRQLKSVPSIRAVTDHIGSPTFAKDFAERLQELISEDRRGVVHLVNSGSASRYDMAKEIVSRVKPEARVEAVSYKSFGLSVDRQASEVLNSSLPPLRHWRDALGEYLGEE